MVRARVIETDQGIQGDFNVQIYNGMMRRLRDKGWMETDHIIRSGITEGLALEIGPGPGYLGLEWLKKTKGTILRGLEISPDMIKLAERNVKEYGYEDRVKYITGDSKQIPFGENEIDALFTNGSLHEWSQPKKIFDEIYRVLRPGGKYFISDLRRDIHPFVKWFMYFITKPKEIRPGLMTSMDAAYTVEEIKAVLKQTELKEAIVTKTFMGFEITGDKIQ